MAPTKTASPGDLLTQAAGERQTGALMVGGHPGGAVYVFEGRVIYAESPAAPGVGEMLTSSGRLAARTWQNALDLGTSTAQVGRLLVEQGHLTRGELELCVLGATYDAAYFLLSQPDGPVDFLAGATHWLGVVVHIDAGAVTREVRRRVRLLDEIFPNPRIDTAPVIPVTRAPRERITLTAPQWELLVHADGQRTPADLALLLGRAGYATIQELRRLAAAGMIELPAVRAAESPEFVRLAHPRGDAVPRTRPVAGIADPSPVPVISSPAPVRSRSGGSRSPAGPTRAEPVPARRAPAQPAPPQPAPAQPAPPQPAPAQPVPAQPVPARPARGRAARAEPVPAEPAAAGPSAADPPAAGSPAGGPPMAGPPAAEDAVPVSGEPPPAPPGDGNAAVYRPPRLARRKPGAKLPKEIAAAESQPVHPGTDEVLLKRIRTALRALR